LDAAAFAELVGARVHLIAREDPERLERAAVRFLGRACLERSFITLDDAQLLVAYLAQLERADEESRVSFASALRRLRLERRGPARQGSNAGRAG
jgi:hypothetical protein